MHARHRTPQRTGMSKSSMLVCTASLNSACGSVLLLSRGCRRYSSALQAYTQHLFELGFVGRHACYANRKSGMQTRTSDRRSVCKFVTIAAVHIYPLRVSSIIKGKSAQGMGRGNFVLQVRNQQPGSTWTVQGRVSKVSWSHVVCCGCICWPRETWIASAAPQRYCLAPSAGMATPELQPKVTYKPKAKLEPFFTGAAARVTRDSKHLVCACGDEVKVPLAAAWAAQLGRSRSFDMLCIPADRGCGHRSSGPHPTRGKPAARCLNQAACLAPAAVVCL